MLLISSQTCSETQAVVSMTGLVLDTMGRADPLTSTRTWVEPVVGRKMSLTCFDGLLMA